MLKLQWKGGLVRRRTKLPGEGTDHASLRAIFLMQRLAAVDQVGEPLNSVCDWSSVEELKSGFCSFRHKVNSVLPEGDACEGWVVVRYGKVSLAPDRSEGLGKREAECIPAT